MATRLVWPLALRLRTLQILGVLEPASFGFDVAVKRLERPPESWMKEMISIFTKAALSAVVACMIAVRILYSVDPRTKVLWRRK
jgi:hypothetical protein